MIDLFDTWIDCLNGYGEFSKEDYDTLRTDFLLVCEAFYRQTYPTANVDVIDGVRMEQLLKGVSKNRFEYLDTITSLRTEIEQLKAHISDLKGWMDKAISVSPIGADIIEAMATPAHKKRGTK